MQDPRTVDVAETFVSIQGESTYAGLVCFFVRLAGCNLACRYCDTPAARARGAPASIDGLVTDYRRSGAALAEITGGEPLLQPACAGLARCLREAGPGPVLVETNGTRDLSVLPAGVIAVMDIKCPGSGAAGSTDWDNLGRLRPQDEVKFVLADRHDYEWARDVVRQRGLARICHAVLFSPVWSALDPGQLGQWILEDRLAVRLQVQLHRVVGMP